jgi:hypothetical protein
LRARPHVWPQMTFARKVIARILVDLLPKTPDLSFLPISTRKIVIASAHEC